MTGLPAWLAGEVARRAEADRLARRAAYDGWARREAQAITEMIKARQPRADDDTRRTS